MLEDINILIKNNKVEEALQLLESYVKKLPDIFQTALSVQYADFTKYKWLSLMDADDQKEINKLKIRMLEFCGMISSYEKTGEIPINITEKNAQVQINNSKNFNTGTINANGNVNIGDNSN